MSLSPIAIGAQRSSATQRTSSPSRPTQVPSSSATATAVVDTPPRSIARAQGSDFRPTPQQAPLAAQLVAIADFCHAADDLEPAGVIEAAQVLQQGSHLAMHDASTAARLHRVFALAAEASQYQEPSEDQVRPLRHALLQLAAAAGTAWRGLHPLPAPPAGFPITGFDSTGPQRRHRRALRSAHLGSAVVSAATAKVSPTLRDVQRRNAVQLDALYARRPPLGALHGADALPPGISRRDVVLAQCTPALLDAVRDQLLEHMDDAFLTNLRRHAKKAGGALQRLVTGDDRALTRTRAQLVAEMLDLDNPASALNQALEELAPRMFEHQPLAQMGRLELTDLVLKLATQTIDRVMQPSPAEARRTAGIIVELRDEAQQAFEGIHLDAMKRLRLAALKLPADAPPDAVTRLVEREARQTSQRIEAVRKQVFDTFRERNGGEFGFNSLSEQIRENNNIEFYKTVLLPGAAWSGLSRVVGAGMLTIGGPAGLALTVSTAAVLQYVTAVTSQISVGATGAAAADLKPLDARIAPRGVVDPQTYWNQRNLSATIQKIGAQALHDYTRPGNAGAQACRQKVLKIERDLGYDQDIRCALAPELLALADYYTDLAGTDTGGLDNALPGPIRIAELLHTFADELPDMKSLSTPGMPLREAARRTVVEALVDAIHRRCPDGAVADAPTIARRAREHGAELVERSGMDRVRFGRMMAPDAAAMHAGGVGFSSLIRAMLQASGLTEQVLFDSQGFLSAQYRGLFVNAVAGLSVQMLVGVAAFFGISAATAAGTPAAGFGAAVGFAALSFAAGAIPRDASAVSWYRKDRESQTNANVYRMLRSPEGRPLSGDRDRQVAEIEQAVLANHVPLYKRRMDQLMASIRAAFEKELIGGSEAQQAMGFNLLHALEQDPAERGRPPFAAELAGESMDALHAAPAVAKHQALLDTHASGMRMVSAVAEAAQEVIGEPNGRIAPAAKKYLDDRKAYGIRDSYEFQARNARFFPDDAGRVRARDSIDGLRERARACFDRYLMRYHGRQGFRVSQCELDSLKAALRTPHADQTTELWLAALELRLGNQGILAKDGARAQRAYHLSTSALSHERADALRQRHARLAAKADEHTRAMQLLTQDLMALRAGHFSEIRDPLGIIEPSLAHFSNAGQISRHYRVNNDLPFIAFARGTMRFAGQVCPVTLRGAAGMLVVLGSGALAIAQSSPDHIGEVTVHPLHDTDLHQLDMHPRFGGLAGPLAGGMLNAVQPETNPATFQASGQLQFLRGGFMPNDPSFQGLLRDCATGCEHFRLSVDHWGGELLNSDAVIDFLQRDAGTTQLKLQLDRKLRTLPDTRFLSRQDRIRWDAARKQSKRNWTTRLDSLHPRRFIPDLTYGKHARHHFKEVQRDRHRLAATLVVAGHQLAGMGAPAEPPLASELAPDCAAFADAMVFNILRLPGAADQIFATRPPATLDEQHRVVLQVALKNPWYLLQLVQIHRGQIQDGDPAVLENLLRFQDLLTHDVLAASVPLLERKLQQAIAMCNDAPLRPQERSDLELDLASARADCNALADGPERDRLHQLVETFAAELATAPVWL